jgi:hypothetical protein
MSISKAEKPFPGHFEVQWTETMHMLDLSANQIDLTIFEGNESIELLLSSFTTLTTHLDALEKMLHGSNDHSRLMTTESIQQHCKKTKDRINQTIIGLQFYDRMSQRLHNVREGLAVLAALIDDPDRQNIPEEWITLRDKIKTKFSLAQQKTIFHALMQGTDIDEVFELFEDD